MLHDVGFDYCPAEMMASNPQWCLTVSEWQEQFNNWITNPTNEKIMLCTIFFDYGMVYGDRMLVLKMTESIYKSIAQHEIFLNFLGVNAVKTPPPLSFFRNFLVEASGEYKNQFDVKARALMPLVDAARLLILFHNQKDCNNTIARYERLLSLEPQNRDLYEACIGAFKTVSRFKTLQGMKRSDSGRYVDLDALSKPDRLRLKTSFKPIKDIQELLMVRFGLSQLM
jgi:CBS domain-containing protein